jgi:hypothetical protein
MPIPKPNGSEKESEYINRCISEIASEYDVEGQAYAVCKSTYDKENMAKIPVEIAGDNEVKILEYLPEVKPKEMENEYLDRCVIVLYPEYVDEQQAYSLCADKYQRKITIQNNKVTMKAEKISPFERNRLNFQVAVAESEARGRGIFLADYPWEECVADQIKQYGDEETAKKVCGMIKSKYGGGE